MGGSPLAAPWSWDSEPRAMAALSGNQPGSVRVRFPRRSPPPFCLLLLCPLPPPARPSYPCYYYAACDFGENAGPWSSPGGCGTLAGWEGSPARRRGFWGPAAAPACTYLMSGNGEAAGGGPGRRVVLTIARLRNSAASSAPGLTVLAFQEDFITLERARERHVTNEGRGGGAVGRTHVPGALSLHRGCVSGVPAFFLGLLVCDARTLAASGTSSGWCWWQYLCWIVSVSPYFCRGPSSLLH